MSYTIAICGKGGTGKTTFSALLIRQMLEKHINESILAIDADPNANLDQSLGRTSENTIVSLVDEISENPSVIPKGMTKDRYLEYHIQDAIVEGEGVDVLSMGRPEGPGCYCFINNLLRTLIEKISKAYEYIVIDNEAGMEHLSRRTTRKIDMLFLVSDYSLVGLRAAKRIYTLTKELKLRVKDHRLVVNRVPGNDNLLQKQIDDLGINYAGSVPQDDELAQISIKSGNIMDLSRESIAYSAVQKIYEGVLCQSKK